MQTTTPPQLFDVGDYVQYMGSLLRYQGVVMKVVRVVPQPGWAPCYVLQDAWVRIGPTSQSSLCPDPWLTD